MVATYADPSVIYADPNITYIGGNVIDRFWVRNISGSAGLWTDPAHWSSISGGPGGASVPGPLDNVVFDGNGISGVTINAAVNVTSIIATSAYTGAGANDGRFDNATNDQSITVSGDVTLDNKQVDMGDATWALSGNFDASDVTTFNANASLLKLTGATSGTQTIEASGIILNNMEIDDSGATKSFTTDVQVKAFTNTAGTILANANTIFVETNWSNSGTFTAGTGTVELVTGGAAAITGSTTFNIFKVDVALSKTITWDNTATSTFATDVTIKTTTGNTVTMVSDLPGTKYSWDVQGTFDIVRVDVTDCDASTGTEIRALNSLKDGQNNDNWVFVTSKIKGIEMIVDSLIIFPPALKGIELILDPTFFPTPINENCIITIKTLPAVADLLVEARLEQKIHFFHKTPPVADNSKRLDANVRFTALTDTAGQATITLPTEFNRFEFTKDMEWRIIIKRLDFNVAIDVPDEPTAKLADMIRTS